MEKLSQPKHLSSVIAAVEEIVSIYRSLPPRPSIEEVEAARAVLRTVDSEDKLKLEMISSQNRPPDVPEELFFVLQEVKRNMVLLQSLELRKEAVFLVELDERFWACDELIQRASKLVSLNTERIKDGGFGDSVAEIVKKCYGNGEKEKVQVSEAVEPCSSKKDEVFSGGDADKLSLIKVASIIETSAKNGAKVLDLQGKLRDEIEWLPVSLAKLSDITDLNLSENRIAALPSSISSLKCLVKLDVHSNLLESLPESFGELSNLLDLDLHGNQLRALPQSFGSLASLINLDLSSNRLVVLPDTLGNLTSLKTLNLETNELEELPYTIGSCSSLAELRLDFNQLKALPEAIGKLECLEILTLHYNRIKSLPTTIGSLSRLREVDVSFNELEFVPEDLCFAKSLVKLNIGKNFADLRSLPWSIGNLQMLEELDISNNQIRILPDSFRFLTKLKVFHADETPLEVPPRQIVELGAQAVVEYMADLEAGEAETAEHTEKKGFWFWLLSTCQRWRKNHDKKVQPKKFDHRNQI